MVRTTKVKKADDVANAVAYGFDSYYALIIGKPIGAAYDLKKVGVFQSQEEVDNYVDKEVIRSCRMRFLVI
mgnify:CR=1 FL=1